MKKAILVLAALSIVGAYVWAHYHSNNSPDRQQLATQIRILEYTLAEDLALAVNETFGPNDPWSDELYTAISNKTCITSEACLTEIIEDGWNSLRWGITENIPIIRTQADSLREEPKPKIPAKDLLTKLHALDSNSQRDFIEAVVNIRMWERYSPQLEKQQRIDELKKQLPLPQ